MNVDRKEKKAGRLKEKRRVEMRWSSMEWDRMG
jgi:hypothetical protein